jgi:NADH:ubiquinone oxidoreductase subunit F (NADH-binding)
VIGMVRNLEHFFAQESCGFCTPCRDGLPWIEKLLLAVEPLQSALKYFRADFEAAIARGVAAGQTRAA